MRRIKTTETMLDLIMLFFLIVSILDLTPEWLGKLGLSVAWLVILTLDCFVICVHGVLEEWVQRN